MKKLITIISFLLTFQTSSFASTNKTELIHLPGGFSLSMPKDLEWINAVTQENFIAREARANAKTSVLVSAGIHKKRNRLLRKYDLDDIINFFKRDGENISKYLEYSVESIKIEGMLCKHVSALQQFPKYPSIRRPSFKLKSDYIFCGVNYKNSSRIIQVGVKTDQFDPYNTEAKRLYNTGLQTLNTLAFDSRFK